VKKFHSDKREVCTISTVFYSLEIMSFSRRISVIAPGQAQDKGTDYDHHEVST